MHHVSGQSLAFDKNCDESAEIDLSHIYGTFAFYITNLIKQLCPSYRINRLKSILIRIIYMALLFEFFDKFQLLDHISADRISTWPAGSIPIQFRDDFEAECPN